MSNNTQNIQWFPGHMAKTKRKIAEQLKIIDAVVEIVDARTPISSRNPDLREIIGDKPLMIILNKCDMADAAATAKWIEHFKDCGIIAIPADCKSGKGTNAFKDAVKMLLADRLKSYKEKGMVGKPLRVMAVGIPNVGKSSFINKIAGNSRAKVENRPGVTRGNQWFTVDKVSGRNGELCTFKFDKNESGVARNQNFVFKPNFAGTNVAVYLTFMQKAWSSIESVTIRNFNSSSMTAGEIIPDGYTVTIPNTNTARSPFCYTIDIVGEGGVDIMFAEPGTSELAYSDWLFSGRKTIEDSEYNVIGFYYTLSAMANSGEQRALDMVILAAGTEVELFRMHVVQSAGN